MIQNNTTTKHLKTNKIMDYKSAVEWLIENMNLKIDFLESKRLIKLFEQAKEKEKQQIIDSYDEGMGHYGDANRRSDAEQYYKKTFKNK